MWASRFLVAMVVLLVPGRIEAQAPAPDVTAAARAFEQGQSAQLRNEWSAAADMFELADRLAPSVQALRSAIRNRLAAEQWARAATLGLAALSRYPADGATRTVADQALGRASSLGRLRVTCAEPCMLTIDDAAYSTVAVRTADIFVLPGDHVLVGRFEDRQTETPVTAEAGQEYTIALEPPEPVPTEPDSTEIQPDETDALAGSNDETRPPIEPATGADARGSSSGGLPVWLPLATAGAALVALGVTLWSGLDTLSASDEYEAAPTRAGFEDGVARENRTNVFIGLTAALGLTAVVMAIFTDWSPDSERDEGDASITFDLGPTGSRVSGRF
jgi:hypothetical protein